MLNSLLVLSSDGLEVPSFPSKMETNQNQHIKCTFFLDKVIKNVLQITDQATATDLQDHLTNNPSQVSDKRKGCCEQNAREQTVKVARLRKRLYWVISNTNVAKQ